MSTTRRPNPAPRRRAVAALFGVALVAATAGAARARTDASVTPITRAPNRS